MTMNEKLEALLARVKHLSANHMDITWQRQDFYDAVKQLMVLWDEYCALVTTHAERLDPEIEKERRQLWASVAAHVGGSSNAGSEAGPRFADNALAKFDERFDYKGYNVIRTPALHGRRDDGVKERRYKLAPGVYIAYVKEED